MSVSRSTSTKTSAPPRILHVIHGLTVGGAEVDFLNKCRCLIGDYGYEITICCLLRRGDLAPEFEAAGARVLGPFMRFRYDASPVFKLRRLISAKEWDLVHSHMFWANLITWMLMRTMAPWKRPKLLLSEHSMAERWGAMALLFKKLILGTARVLLVPTKTAKNSYVDRGLPEASIRVLPNCIDLDHFANVDRDSTRETIRQTLDLAKDEIVLGTVCRLEAVKGLSNLFQAVEPLPVKLIVIGDGSQRNTLARAIRKNDLEDKIFLLGERTDIASILPAFDVFVLSSLSESFGIVVAEALLMQVPVVATSVGGIREITQDGSFCLLVPPGDIPALRRGIQEALDNLEKFRTMATEWRDAVGGRFRTKNITAELNDIYREIDSSR